MSTYYNVHLLVGVSLKEQFKGDYKDKVRTKYNQTTGEPYEQPYRAWVVTFDGVDYEMSGANTTFSDDEEEGYPKGELQKAVEAKYPSLTFMFPDSSPEQGVLGVPIGTEQGVGGNVYIDADVTAEEIQRAFERFVECGPDITPTLLAVMTYS